MHSFSDTHALFDEIPQPNVVTWNTMISGYVHAAGFETLCRFSCALTGPMFLNSLQDREARAWMIALVVANRLIDSYGKCGLWNMFANNGYIELAYKFLNLMPNPDTVSYNGLINGIIRVGNMEDVVHVLSSLPNPNSSSWNSEISGFVNRNRTREALDMFCKMHLKNVEMDEFTFSTILDGIFSLAALTWGMLIHCCTIKCGLDDSVVIGSALIDMYSRSGLLMFC
ncbi:unnamed protein product [Sphenostylis stenocarpa]|uniref:Pentatricopeptide repeat-containing protein n=1 Tax=Sphenostylis stenocarpa TaxID=92480 RepID=A0AA86SPX3_9FABA|nr:unnamed protein product [Sphenostylis stenocarpa]